ncbi:CWC16 protein [Halteromyces radiatus]|uniref:CWC16 protein n=1 Tax=Halteromyces radiatus TaxID=101107 RepID=UPI002220A228|nr:CWC16 protein [Halteromyces radiatus]KAI8099391.1 CWC16 protein [Halteromyces radiatus]
MSERKVLNKYFPPNFDPSKIPKQKKPKDLQHKVRLMAPFSMRCESCGEYIYKGKKFNARKETVQGEKYLSIQIFRFYIRCPRCSAEITFKTDPKNSDYVPENGVSRNFEPWRGDDGTVVEEEPEEEQDAMASLESRTLDSKREMEIMDALDEIRTRNARSERVNVDDVLDQYSKEVKDQVQQQLSAEAKLDEEETAAAFRSADGETVRKVTTAPVDAISLVRQKQQEEVNNDSSFAKPSAFKRKETPNNFGIVVKKKKLDNTTNNKHTQSNALSSLASYDDDSDSD